MKHLNTTLIDFPKITDPRGNLTVAQSFTDVPFAQKPGYGVYDVTRGEIRGGQSHKECNDVILAQSGSFHVTVDNGEEQKTVLLNHPYQGLLIDTDVWRTLDDFSSGAVCLVLASEPFDEDDYIREYDDFLRYLADKK